MPCFWSSRERGDRKRGPRLRNWEDHRWDSRKYGRWVWGAWDYTEGRNDESARTGTSRTALTREPQGKRGRLYHFFFISHFLYTQKLHDETEKYSVTFIQRGQDQNRTCYAYRCICPWSIQKQACLPMSLLLVIFVTAQKNLYTVHKLSMQTHTNCTKLSHIDLVRFTKLLFKMF